jgi:hypothetical protein
MKSRAIIFSLVVAAAAFAVQDEVKFTRSFKAGDKDNYSFNVQLKTAMGDMEMQMKMSQEITKVFENGEAEQKTTISDMKMFMNGTDVSAMAAQGMGAQAPIVVRIDKNGMPVDKKQAQGGGPMGQMSQLMSLGSMMTDKPMKIGQAVPIDMTDPKDPKSTVKGTVVLEAVEAGVARVKSDIQIANPQMPKPMQVKTVALVDVATSKPNKVTGEVIGVPAQGMQIDQVKFTMERVK